MPLARPLIRILCTLAAATLLMGSDAAAVPAPIVWDVDVSSSGRVARSGFFVNNPGVKLNGGGHSVRTLDIIDLTDFVDLETTPPFSYAPVTSLQEEKTHAYAGVGEFSSAVPGAGLGGGSFFRVGVEGNTATVEFDLDPTFSRRAVLSDGTDAGFAEFDFIATLLPLAPVGSEVRVRRSTEIFENAGGFDVEDGDVVTTDRFTFEEVTTANLRLAPNPFYTSDAIVIDGVEYRTLDIFSRFSGVTPTLTADATVFASASAGTYRGRLRGRHTIVAENLSVPEPAALTTLASGGLLLLRRRRRVQTHVAGLAV